MARGSIKQRSPGSWRIRVAVGRDPATGKLHQRSETFRGNRHDAETRMAQMVLDAAGGTLGPATNLTLADFLERWLRDHAEPHCAPMTMVRYANLLSTHV